MARESQRRKAYEIEIDAAREKIIKHHKLCGGTGFIEKSVKSKGFGFARQTVEYCGCRKKFDIVSKFIISNIPYKSLVNQQIYGKLVTDIAAKDKIELRKEIIRPYIKHLKKAMKNPYGFLFLGKNGTGKTFIGLKILYYAVIMGFTAHNIEMADFLKLARKLFDRDPDTERLLNEILSVDILMVDEIGNESKRSSYVISEFKSLYKKRVSMGKPTILITNYSYKDFNIVYGKSIHNMVQSHCRIFDFSEAADVRKTKCSGEMDLFFKKIKRRK